MVPDTIFRPPIYYVDSLPNIAQFGIYATLTPGSNFAWMCLPMKDKAMATVHDVAAYILKKQGSMTTMKLQKLVYYCQAWSLVWDDKALFPEKIQAWANGPVVADLYEVHRGKYSVGSWTLGNCKNLSEIQRETIDAVLGYYGDKSSQWLSDLTHKEDPWLNARKGLPSGARGSKVITHASMAEYYEALA